jgi:hypothetical protein
MEVVEEGWVSDLVLWIVGDVEVVDREAVGILYADITVGIVGVMFMGNNYHIAYFFMFV